MEEMRLEVDNNRGTLDKVFMVDSKRLNTLTHGCFKGSVESMEEGSDNQVMVEAVRRLWNESDDYTFQEKVAGTFTMGMFLEHTRANAKELDGLIKTIKRIIGGVQ